jgi:Ca2+ transporting ATPase
MNQPRTSSARTRLARPLLPWQAGRRALFGRFRVTLRVAEKDELSSGLESGPLSSSSAESPTATFSVSTDLLSNLTALHVGDVFGLCDAVRSPEELAAVLDSDPLRGIKAASGVARAQAFGLNTTPSPEPTTFFELVLEALSDFTVLTLIGAAGVSITLELWLATREGREANVIEGVSIIIAVAVVVLVSAGNNWQKEKQFQALEKISSRAFVRAVRDGGEVRLATEEVVVGDVLKLETGDILCADGVLLQGFDIKVDESHLTGESGEVTKDARTSQALLSGSKVLCGVGTMIVTAVGRASQSGIIADLTVAGGRRNADSGESAQTTLQKQLEVYASNIGKVGVVAAVATTLAMGIKFSVQTFIVQGQGWSIDYLETFLGFFITGVTILVVAIPEGLPLAVTISLAYSVKKMLEDNNLVRHLSAAETMGTATVICTDKTGTLTQNVMNVQNMWFDGKLMGVGALRAFQTLRSPSKLVLAQAIALNATAKIFTDGEGAVQKSGNKTEIALLGLLEEWEQDDNVSISADCKRLETDAYRAVVVEQRPFTSESKRMSSVVEYTYKGEEQGQPSRLRLYTKGAAEVIIAQCSRVLVGSREEALSSDRRGAILDAMHSDSRSLRLLAVAYRDVDPCPSGGVVPDDAGDANIEARMPSEDLTLLAVVGIADPLRPEVPEAIQKAHRAGISVRMFTGDNPVTAASIAVECGIMDPLDASNPRAVVEGRQFMRNISSNARDGNATVACDRVVVDKDKFLEHWRDLKVLARCSPSDKFTVVEALKKYTDEIVAVTGDGTNDAPALRMAHVGFAMNDGTQVAKDAADIILVDNNFASTINAALWGRNVYSNITKFLQFQLTVNIVALITAAGGAVASAESPLTTVQMLWVNLIMDSLASLALATGSPDLALLNQKPYGKEHNFVDPSGPLPKHILGQVVYQLAVLAWLLGPAPEMLGIPYHIPGNGPSIHHTLVFNTFVMMQLFNQLNARLINDSDGILDNIQGETLFQWVLCSEFLLQFVIVQYGEMFFNTTGLPVDLWLVSLGFGAASLGLRGLIVFSTTRL